MGMTINSGISGGSNLRDRMGAQVNGRLWAADFRSEQYWLGNDAVAFGDLVTFSRAEALTYFDPTDSTLKPSPVNSPVFFDPKGRRGLNVSSVRGSLLAELPSAAGTYTNTYAASRDNTACILMVFGKPGAWLKVSGDLVATFPDSPLEGGRFKAIYLTLKPTGTSRSVKVEYNDKVVGWKLGIDPFEEFGGASFGGGSGTVPTVGVSAAGLAALNAADVFTIRGDFVPMPHRGGLPDWGRSFSVRDGDGNGIFLSMTKGAWRLASVQAVAAGGQAVKTWDMPIARYLLADARSEALTFAISINKSAETVEMRTSAGRVLKGIPLPAMSAITAVETGRHGTTLPKMSVRYLAAHTL